MKFKLESTYKPTGDQPQAIEGMLANLKNNKREQVLLGVTGSGKTFSIANVIAAVQKPTLVISHNKTLAGQLYQEFRDFFPTNAVSYFVSYYDYYQPEAYIPQTDTYIEKETEINEEIDKLRLAATTNILTRKDTIVVASVSCIYNIGSPKEYGEFVLELATGMKVTRDSIMKRLTQLQYERSDYGFHRSTFRVRGNAIDLFPAYQDHAIRIEIIDDFMTELATVDPLTGKKVTDMPATVIYPAKHFMTDPRTYKDVFGRIRDDMEAQVKKFTAERKFIEAQRIEQKVNYDLEMIQELGYVNGIENYSRYFDGRKPGDPPYTLFDYFKQAAGDDFLLVIDESHMTVPQIRGMYHGDQSRKQTLVDFGFRLPSAMDNRPLTFDEFLRREPATIYVSATPDDWELSRAAESGGVVEQLIRPTGLIDPVISVRPVTNQVDDLLTEVRVRVERHERVLVSTLTKQMAEDLAAYFEQHDIKVQYLHSDVLTLERNEILSDLRSGKYDVIIGVNLLREGLDLPEVSLVAILDADKEGFLRSRTSLIQTMGRAARHIKGEVILYADRETKAIAAALAEVGRRREKQLAYNKAHGITPEGINKPIRDRLVELAEAKQKETAEFLLDATEEDISSMAPSDKQKHIKKLKKEMSRASRELNFELAVRLRDMIRELESA